MINPMSNLESTSIISKKHNKKGDTEFSEMNIGSITVELVGMNKGIDICAEACSCCWDKKIPDDYEGRSKYVSRRTFTGHTSILEHSNFVIYLKVPKAYSDSLMEYITWTNYLSKKLYKNFNGDWIALIGGSYRGYSDVYLNTTDLTNPVLKAIASCLYTYAPSSAFEDVCKYGFMDKAKFMDVTPDENFKILTTHYNDNNDECDLFKIVGLDDAKLLYTNIFNIDRDFATHLSTSDLLDFITVTVMFKNMSRTATHQMVRHRDGITQESQRYVDYSNAGFNSPDKYKDIYDSNHKYKIVFGDLGHTYMTLEELGKAMCGIYSCLANVDIAGIDHALKKEDARAYLPSNVQCHKIYMTFTYKKLFKFLQLRECPAAQAEIRLNATTLGKWIRENTQFASKEITDEYTKPKLLIEDPFKIDAIEIHEDVKEITDEDYIKAAGLDKPE